MAQTQFLADLFARTAGRIENIECHTRTSAPRRFGVKDLVCIRQGKSISPKPFHRHAFRNHRVRAHVDFIPDAVFISIREQANDDRIVIRRTELVRIVQPRLVEIVVVQPAGLIRIDVPECCSAHIRCQARTGQCVVQVA